MGALALAFQMSRGNGSATAMATNEAAKADAAMAVAMT
jgi:hypothetical protein